MAPAINASNPKPTSALTPVLPQPVPPQLSPTVLCPICTPHSSPHVSSSGHHQSPKLSPHLTHLSVTHSPLKVMCPTPLYTYVHTSHMHTCTHALTSDTLIWVCTRITHAHIIHTGMHMHDAPHTQGAHIMYTRVCTHMHAHSPRAHTPHFPT